MNIDPTTDFLTESKTTTSTKDSPSTHVSTTLDSATFDYDDVSTTLDSATFDYDDVSATLDSATFDYDDVSATLDSPTFSLHDSSDYTFYLLIISIPNPSDHLCYSIERKIAKIPFKRRLAINPMLN